MEKFGKYQIILEKGTAKKPFSELSQAEREEASSRILKKVFLKAKEFGLVPVIKNPSPTSNSLV